MTLGLALSGGGFRATLFHLGVVRFLHDAKLLSSVTHICSVSGGSVFAAHLVLNWERYTGDANEFDSASSELLTLVKADVRGRVSRRLFGAFLRRTIIPPLRVTNRFRLSATDLLGKYYSILYKSSVLADLQGTENQRPSLFLLTTNLTDGSLCAFTAQGFLNDNDGHLIQAQTFPLATAVAASSAFPGFFPPIALTPDNLDVPEHILGHARIALTDGGVFDNLGLRKFQNIRRDKNVNIDHILLSDASHRFLWDKESMLLQPLRTSLRASDILSKRIHDLEVEMAHDSCFVAVNIDAVIPRTEDQHALLPDIQVQLPSIRTDLDEFSDLEIRALTHHGYCVARSATRRRLVQLPLACLESRPWDPTSETAKPIGRAEKQILSRSKFRKFRLLSFRDGATYVHVSLILAAVLGFFFLPKIWSLISSPRKERQLRAEIVSKTKSLVQQYTDVILSRKGTALGGYFTQPLTGRDNWVETWATSQAAFALLSNPNVSKDEHDYIDEVIERRFTATDWNPMSKGWVTRSGSSQLQAEPALWTAGAIASRLTMSDLSEEERQRLIESFKTVETTLSNYHTSVNETEAWYIFPNQKNKAEHSPYTAALAILVLLKARDARLPWEGSPEKRDEIIVRTANWLISRFESDADPPGWRGIAWPPAGNDVSDGFTFQVLAELLMVENSGLGFRIPIHVTNSIPARLRLLEKLGGLDNRGRTLLTVVDEKGEHLSECSVTFLWQPWAILTCKLWLLRLENAGAPAEERLPFRTILHKLIVDQGDRALRQASNNSIYMSAEMLYALSEVKAKN